MKVSELIAALEEFQTKLIEHRKLLEKRMGYSEKRAALEEQSRWLSRRLGTLRPYLERFDKDWMEVAARRAAYPSLDPGPGISDHLGQATSLDGPHKSYGLRKVLEKLPPILGRLENFDPNEEIPADPTARRQIADQKSKNTSEAIASGRKQYRDTKTWITASTIMLGLGREVTRHIICKPAHAGLIQARAQRFVRNGRSADNVKVPPEFWWAEGGDALTQNWDTGDFETWIDDQIHLQAFGVSFRRSDLERLNAPQLVWVDEAPGVPTDDEKRKVFIGHGHSLVWLELKSFLQDDLHLTSDEFNRVSTAGVATSNRLKEMLSDAAFAFLILTAEDESTDGKLHARENVVHEAGLFQGRLGFEKAILLLEENCEKFSNIDGLGYIPFPTGKIRGAFEDIRSVLQREGLIGGGSPSSGGGPPERQGLFRFR